jgi:tRNA threonylcarbamoyl adenosine modification protein (Sua5/YciO/YrdC/YwlC family)
MKIITLSDALGCEREEVASGIRAGRIFIYPTDTVYGIGCDAANESSVNRINAAKSRPPGKTFSFIAPSLEWIRKNTTVSEVNFGLMKAMLPGPYTFIIRVKRGGEVPKTVVSAEGTVGVRIPRHRFADFVRGLGVLFIATSVNVSGDEPATSLEAVPEKIKASADAAVDAGVLDDNPSRVFDCTTDNVKVLR